jgi:hypothetical protein
MRDRVNILEKVVIHVLRQSVDQRQNIHLATWIPSLALCPDTPKYHLPLRCKAHTLSVEKDAHRNRIETLHEAFNQMNRDLQ